MKKLLLFPLAFGLMALAVSTSAPGNPPAGDKAHTVPAIRTRPQDVRPAATAAPSPTANASPGPTGTPPPSTSPHPTPPPHPSPSATPSPSGSPTHPTPPPHPSPSTSPNPSRAQRIPRRRRIRARPLARRIPRHRRIRARPRAPRIPRHRRIQARQPAPALARSRAQNQPPARILLPSLLPRVRQRVRARPAARIRPPFPLLRVLPAVLTRLPLIPAHQPVRPQARRYNGPNAARASAVTALR